MGKYASMSVKIAEDGSRVTLYRSSSDEWLVGRRGDDAGYFPTPMGAFGTERAARAWADRHFPGGDWRVAGGDRDAESYSSRRK